MFDKIRSVFECFGFVQISTPAVERRDVLTGGDANFSKAIFDVALKSAGDDALALRFDLTVPLARLIAQYPAEPLLARPFRRYQLGTVWRGEKPQAGRYREFYQFDADIVGSSDTASDAEIVALMCQTMTALGIQRFKVKINNRKILNGLSDFAKFDQQWLESVLRIIDKLDKQEWSYCAGEIANLGISAESISQLERFVQLELDPSDPFKNIAELMASISVAEEGISELRDVYAKALRLGASRDNLQIDLSVARGLGYYTGPVFETVLTDRPGIGSVFSGGRYDDLVARFGSNSLPAVGASVGVDRLLVVMTELGLGQQEVRCGPQVLVLNFDPGAENQNLEYTRVLRACGVATEMYFGREATLKAQIQYALKKQIPFLVITGSDELAQGAVTIRNLSTRSQKRVAATEFLADPKEYLQ